MVVGVGVGGIGRGRIYCHVLHLNVSTDSA